jgi:hypothetical protein
VLAVLKELKLAILNVLLFTLCNACVSALVIRLSGSPCERIGRWETCPIFERGQIVGEHLAGGASLTETAALLGVSRVTVSKVMSAYTNRGKTTLVKNSEQKSTPTERDRRILRKFV